MTAPDGTFITMGAILAIVGFFGLLMSPPTRGGFPAMVVCFLTCIVGMLWVALGTGLL